ncbi:diguanylate cyclase domain-containing protein [Dongia sp.]|uniref:sensor domain-containing diguanylate cyclase n=1 Tax=Dongia sp. TaxID=1977262 RepID=UPI0037501957
MNEISDKKLISQLSSALAEETSFEGLVRELLGLLELVTDLESTYLTKIDLVANAQQILFSRNSKKMVIPEGLSVPWGDTLCKRAIDEGRPYTDDVAGCWGDSQAAKALGITTYASVPVRLEDGSLYGTLCGASSEKKPMTERGAQVLKLFAKLISQQIERDLLVKELQAANAALRNQSYTDALTGLPNRRAVLENLTRQFATAQRNKQRVVLAFIDLDYFKQINDQFGHDTGDAFLIEVGHKLTAAIRTDDLLGRLGGDEFVVSGFVTPPGEVDSLGAVRRRLQTALQSRFDLPGLSFEYLGASIGVIAVEPGKASPAQALSDADAAMYSEKKTRKEQGLAGLRRIGG